MLLLSLNSTNLSRKNGVSVHYVAHRRRFFFCYHFTEELCNVRTVLECNMWHIEEASASVIT
jgi:hypothetical protein